MEVLIGLLAIMIFFSPLAGVIILRHRIKRLEDLNAELNYRMSKLESKFETNTDFETSDIPEGVFQPASENAPEEINTLLEKESWVETPAEVSQEVVPFIKTKSRRSEFKGPSKHREIMKKLERQFLENWTGILGSVIMVLGAGFLSLYAALKFNEFTRFLLLLLLSALPGSLFFILKDREKWERQALWMRSISGAIFLFACLGSAGIPGLQWVHNPIQSLGLLGLGIAVNLGLSSLGKKQEFASFHSLLSLLALSVMTPGFASLVMAVIITLYALIHCFRNRWDVHLLLVLTGFFAYHLYWMQSLSEIQFEALRLQGAAALILIFLVSTFVHYRKSYATVHFQLRPFLTHLLNWLYFSVGMYLYVGEKPERSIAIFAGSLLAFTLSQRAEKKRIPWLRTTSIVMGETLLCATLISLKGWDVSSLMIGGFIYIEVLLFLHIMVRQRRYGLYRFAVYLYILATLALLSLCFENPGRNSLIYSCAVMILGLLHHHILYHSKDTRFLRMDVLLPSKKEFSISGFLCGISGSTALLLLIDLNNGIGKTLPYPIAAVLTLSLLIAYHSAPSRGLRTGALVYLVILSSIGWSALLSNDFSPKEQLYNTLILFVSAGMTYFWKPAVHSLISYTGLIISSVTLMVLSFLILNPVSPLLPGLFWLLMVIFIMESPGLPERFRTMALLFLTVFLFRHFIIHIHLAESWGILELRYLMDLALLGTLFVWRRHQSRMNNSFLANVMKYSMDGGVLLAAVLIFIEIPFPSTPLFLSLTGLSILVYRRFSRQSPRMLSYSLAYYGLSLVMLTVSLFADQHENLAVLPGLVTLILQLASLVLFFWKENFTSLLGEQTSEGYKKIILNIERKKHSLLLYSLAAAAALFLYKSFDSQYLTLLWALECFLIFSASLFLGESHFRAISQAGLFLCVIRLVFFDLSESTPLMRGFIFLAVGLLMLGTNSLYNKYKERFS
ncbi:hypothetical protein EXM22_01405 [Oceanispirochaeta crateris]|uniref:DUF2339 domain-containing protein n=1 Tax=Oceanispirochaeta crateris TaxID=2518645 RepID=A0A5C1QGN3_9SPIO|nr:hypothetical protein [Oceanispirochaeta crateris]QEN06711.1 hypothetical protein EXM22_01405 [Oceanispirochaeta crateris]